MLPEVGRAEEARAIADETVTAARAHGNPFWIAFALCGIRASLHGRGPGPGPGRLAAGAHLHAGAPTPALGGEHRPRCRRTRSGPRRARARPRVVRHRHRLASTGPATSPTSVRHSPTWRCSSTASNDPRSPPSSTAPAPAHGTSAQVHNLRAVRRPSPRRARRDPLRRVRRRRGAPWNPPTPCSTPGTRSNWSVESSERPRRLSRWASSAAAARQGPAPGGPPAGRGRGRGPGGWWRGR